MIIKESRNELDKVTVGLGFTFVSSSGEIRERLSQEKFGGGEASSINPEESKEAEVEAPRHSSEAEIG